MPKLDLLHEELNDVRKVARSLTPCLKDFIEGWGKQLIPPRSWINKVDILVIVPHNIIHGIPLHLVFCDHEPLGTIVGITYSSSMSLFSRCRSRNPSRRINLNSWQFENDTILQAKREPLTAIVGGVDVLGDKDEIFREIIAQIADYISGDVLNLTPADSNESFQSLNRGSLKTIFRRPEMAKVLCVAAHGYIDSINYFVKQFQHFITIGILPRH